MSEIIKRIIAKIGIPDIMNVLESIPSTDLQSLLLEIYRKKANELEVRDISQQAAKNRFVSVASVNQRQIATFDHIAYEVLPKNFEAVELSPVAPMGINKVLGGTNQNNVVTTVRNTEVVADPTSTLAIQCAQKRSVFLNQDHTNTSRASLATSHRILRGQSFDDIDGFTPHFRAFALATAGRDVGFERFEKEVVVEHISFYLSLLDALSATNEYNAHDVTVSISDIRMIEQLVSVFKMDRQSIGRNTQNPLYSAFGEYGINLPKTVSSVGNIPTETVEAYGLQKPVEMLTIAEQSIVHLLQKRFPNVVFNFDIERTAGMGYYSTLCFKIAATNESGEKLPLADGGMSTWTQKILNSKKERFFSSGMGSELFCKMFAIT